LSPGTADIVPASARAFELLLLCARNGLNEQQAARVKELVTGGLDWDFLIQVAARHNLRPLLYLNLKKTCLADLPAKVAEELQGVFITVAAKNLFLSHTLEMILERFVAQGIAALPFKGPTLALSAYGNLAARGFGDLDILVDRADLNTAVAILQANGFILELDLDPGQLAAFADHEDHLVFSSQVGVKVELHWELSGRYLARPLRKQDLQSALTVSWLTEHEVPHLSGYTLLVYLAVHGSKHIWERVEWLSCLHELAHSLPEQEWPSALALADSWHCRRMFLLALFLCRELLATELPATIGKEIQGDPRLPELSQHVKHMIYTGSPSDSPGALNVQFSLFHLQVRDTLGDQIRSLLGLFFRPTNADFYALILPAKFAFLYYCFRPSRLLYKGVCRIWGRGDTY